MAKLKMKKKGVDVNILVDFTKKINTVRFAICFAFPAFLRFAAVYLKARSYYLRGQYSRMIDYLSVAISKEEKGRNACKTVNIDGENMMTVEHASQAINDELFLSNMYFDRSRGYLKMGDVDKAIADINTAILKDSKFAEAYYARACFYFFHKDYDKAWEDLNKAKSLGWKVKDRVLEKFKQASTK